MTAWQSTAEADGVQEEAAPLLTHRNDENIHA